MKSTQINQGNYNAFQSYMLLQIPGNFNIIAKDDIFYTILEIVEGVKLSDFIISEELSMNIEELLKKLNLYIMNRIYICKDILYIDGTKFEAYAYQDMIKMN